MNSNWIPNKPISQGAKAYHKAVANTSWHKDNIRGLKTILQNKLEKDYTIIDYGAGTGSSAIYISKILKSGNHLILVDNSPSWLGYAYNLLSSNKKMSFNIIVKEKTGKYQALEKVVGKNNANIVISANTVHLIPELDDTFKGIYKSLKKNGYFIFQSGNIINKNNKNKLMIEDTVREVHDISINIINNSDHFKAYRKGLDERILSESTQRKFVFPDPRPIDLYVKSLKSQGFRSISTSTQDIKIKYKDWLNFLNVRRLQAGILPEIGGRHPSNKEENDRSKIIEIAALELFKKMVKNNQLATKISFTASWTYVIGKK